MTRSREFEPSLDEHTTRIIRRVRSRTINCESGRNRTTYAHAYVFAFRHCRAYAIRCTVVIKNRGTDSGGDYVMTRTACIRGRTHAQNINKQTNKNMVEVFISFSFVRRPFSFLSFFLSCLSFRFDNVYVRLYTYTYAYTYTYIYLPTYLSTYLHTHT